MASGGWRLQERGMNEGGEAGGNDAVRTTCESRANLLTIGAEKRGVESAPDAA